MENKPLGDTIIDKIIKQYLREHTPAQVLEDQACAKAEGADEPGPCLVDQLAALEDD